MRNVAWPKCPKGHGNIFHCLLLLLLLLACCWGRGRGEKRGRKKRRKRKKRQWHEEKEAAKKQKLKPIRTQLLCPQFDVALVTRELLCVCPSLPYLYPTCVSPSPFLHPPAEPKQMQHFVLTGKAWLQQFICLPTPLYILPTVRGGETPAPLSPQSTLYRCGLCGLGPQGVPPNAK